MKATLKFDLPMEDEEFRGAQNGVKYKSVVQQLDEFLRLKIKHSMIEEDVLDHYREMREQIRKELDHWGLTDDFL